MKRCVHSALAVTLVLATTGIDARQPEASGIWLVELEAAPTLEFTGARLTTVTTDGRRVTKRYAATAPGSSGRFDVRSAAVREYATWLDRRRDEALRAASDQLARAIEPRFVFRHLVNGFTVKASPDEVAQLEKVPGVRALQPVPIQYVQTDAGPQWVGATEVWSGATGLGPNRGEGVVIGVVDTGVNWESPYFDSTQPGAPPVSNPRGEMFGLCNDSALDIPCNDKLIGVYDLTDEGTNGFDPDQHGSHVASTAAGLPINLQFPGPNPVMFPTSGVAPRASIITYKACVDGEDEDDPFECSDGTMAALEQALVDQVDVVNFSIAGPGFDPWSSFGNQRLFRNMRAAGIVPVVAASNEGPIEDSIGSPANTPWVLAVGAVTHGRQFETRLVETSGGGFALGELVGQSLSEPLSQTRPIVHAAEFGNALCGTGPAEGGPTCQANTGASNPFPAGTFNGEIVVCDSGVYGALEKGRNLQLAGAGGMIVANTAAAGEFVDGGLVRQCLPTTQVGATDGDRLRSWLDSGTGHRGRITASVRRTVDGAGGRLAVFSSRGPSSSAPGVMKPNLVAPGVEILAAGTQTNADGTGPGSDAANQFVFLLGTSMATPHAAGAAALLRSLHPQWGVSEVISALETTADPSIVTLDDGSEARVIDRGAGGLQVDRATRVGLFLPVTDQEFVSANPATGGDPSALNLAGLFDEACGSECSFERTVEALQSGSWSVSTEGDLNIDVQPQSFSLSAGQRRTLSISVAQSQTAFGGWQSGAVVLTPSSDSHVVQRLQVGVLLSGGDLPGLTTFSSPANRGRATLSIPDLVGAGELTLRSSALVVPESRTSNLPEDPSPFEPFDSDDGTVTELFDVPEAALNIFARTLASTADDIDLFIGRDGNGDGRAQSVELVCRSISPNEIEQCQVDAPEAGTWWIRVQNWSASGAGAVDPVDWEFAVLSENQESGLFAIAPGAHPGGALDVPVYWDQPDMKRNERRVGAIAIATTPDFIANIGVTPIEITRTGVNSPADTALFEGQSEAVVVPGGTRHRKLYIDLPASADGLTVDILGNDVDANLSFLEFAALEATIPSTPNAPEDFIAGSQAVAGGRRITLAAPSGESLAPGRYFVVLDNSAGSERVYDVTATVTETTPADSYRGLWGPSTRSIRQGIDWQIGGGGEFAVWYTYDEASLPTFYITEVVEPPAEESAFFSAPLFRVTSDGVRNTRTPVGEVQVTRLGVSELMYSWRLLGNHGSEIYDAQVNRRCPVIDGAPSPRTGHWTSPETSEGGLTWLITDTAEAFIRYYYDSGNEPRWVLADPDLPPTLPDGNRMEVRDFRGWCIYCDQTAISFEAVGTLERQFIDGQTVREVSDFISRPPLDVSVQNDRLMNRVTTTPECTNP